MIMKKNVFSTILILIGVTHFTFCQGIWTNYTPSNSGVISTIRAIEIDHLNRVWLGYEWSGDGISIFDGSSWTTVDTTNGLSDKRVHVIFEDRNNNMWVGTQNGLCKYDGNWVTYTTADGLVYNYVISIFQDAENNLWFGTVNGVSKFDGTNWTNYSVNDGLANNYVYAISQDTQGNMWFAFGLDPSGVTKFDGVNWNTYTTIDGLISNQVNTILCDHLGNMWFGCYGINAGISQLVGTTWFSYAVGSGPACNNVWASMEDHNHNLWFGTSCHGGTSKYDYTGWTVYDTTNSDIVSNNIIEIAEDSSGNIWFGGYDGLSKYSPQNTIINHCIKDDYSYQIIQEENTITFLLRSQNTQTQIKIYSITGNVIYSDIFSDYEYTINTFGIPKGLYVFQMTTKSKIFSDKIIIN